MLQSERQSGSSQTKAGKESLWMGAVSRGNLFACKSGVAWHDMTYACAATQVEERGHTHIDGAEWEHAQNSVWDKAPEGNNDANVKRWKLLADGGMASC